MQGDGQPAFLRATSIQPYITEELKSSTGYILYQTKDGVKAFGYKSEILPLICEAFIEPEMLAPYCKANGTSTIGVKFFTKDLCESVLRH